MTYHDDYFEYAKAYAKADVKATHYLMKTNAGVFDTELMGRQMGWIDDQRKKAELEAQKERVRQAFGRLDNVKSSQWVGGLIYIEGATNLEQLKHACQSFGIVWKEEGDMVTKNDEINALRSQVAQLTKKLEKLEHGRMGKEPANGTVFKIEKRYDKFGKGYFFAAIRAENLWYLTGAGVDGSKSYTWEALKKFIGPYSRVWAMTAREELVD